MAVFWVLVHEHFPKASVSKPDGKAYCELYATAITGEKWLQKQEHFMGKKGGFGVSVIDAVFAIHLKPFNASEFHVPSSQEKRQFQFLPCLYPSIQTNQKYFIDNLYF